jgi:pilus assembly protein CpaC
MSVVHKNKPSSGKLRHLAALGTLLSSLFLFMPALPNHAVATDLGGGSAESQTGRFFRMALNKSAVVNLPGNAKDVIVGNNDVVDVVIRNKNTAYLFARKTGSTNVFFFDGDGQQLMALDLEVAMDTVPLQKLIRRTLPGTHITVDVLGSNIVLGGTAMNPLEAKTAEDLANQYIASATF